MAQPVFWFLLNEEVPHFTEGTSAENKGTKNYLCSSLEEL